MLAPLLSKLTNILIVLETGFIFVLIVFTSAVNRSNLAQDLAGLELTFTDEQRGEQEKKVSNDI